MSKKFLCLKLLYFLIEMGLNVNKKIIKIREIKLNVIKK